MEDRIFLAEEFRKEAENIYEAILIIAKRARQIGELQKRQIDRELGQTEMLEQQAASIEDEEERIFEPDEDRPQLQFDKPVTKAMQEMMDGEISWNREE